MAEITSLDMADVDRVAAGLDRLADQLGVTVGHLKTVVATEHGSWGNDDFGKNFEQNYVAEAQGAVDQSDAIVRSVRDLSENLRLIAAAFGRLDGDGPLQLETS